MDIIVKFTQWNNRQNHENRHAILSWEKIFPNGTAHNFELSLGYIYGLVLVKPQSSSINVIFNNISYKYPQFLKLPEARHHILASKIPIHAPIVNYMRNLITNHPTIFTSQYIIVLTPTSEDHNHITIIQFDNIIFLQGLLSIFHAFNVGTISHVVTILDRNGIQYTFQN